MEKKKPLTAEQIKALQADKEAKKLAGQVINKKNEDRDTKLKR